MDSGRPGTGLWLSGRFTPHQVDWLVFLGATGFSLAVVLRAALIEEASVALGLAAVPFATVPLLWRRSRPGLVLALITAAFAVSAISGPAAAGGVGLLFAVYAAALYGDRRTRFAGGALALVVLLVAFGTVLSTGTARALGHLAGVAFGYAIAWIHGDRTRTRRAYLAELEARAERLEREQDERAQRAAEQERNRIARELHDIVVHDVSVIAVQAGAARSTSNDDPSRAVKALNLIERTARTTLNELRALLGVLRRDDQAGAPRIPQPKLANIDELVNQARAAGIDIETRVEGTAIGLGDLVELCGYRVVQEALTNVMKHAPHAHVHLLVRYGADDLHLTVVDDGPGAPEDAPTGHGLIGMRERVTLAGGDLRLGPALGGGFRVDARFPLNGDRRPGPAMNGDQPRRS
jgi:signal transduction histidine kinase